MSYTFFGEFMRVLRVKSHEVMGDTAKLLGVKIPFVSAVENGKRNVPDEWIPIIIEHYKLNEEQQKELRTAVEESKTQMKINLTAVSNPKRKLAFQFQRSFDDLDEDTAEEIFKLLNKEDDD
jgi:transcriptional regulator with XRE-family HTH domain